MYRCQICGEVVPPNTPAHRKVIEIRRREYPFRSKAHQFQKDGRIVQTDDPGGVGREIVREILVCPSCSQESANSRADDGGPPVLAIAA